jgi:hypothetical protein
MESESAVFTILLAWAFGAMMNWAWINYKSISNGFRTLTEYNFGEDWANLMLSFEKQEEKIDISNEKLDKIINLLKLPSGGEIPLSKPPSMITKKALDNRVNAPVSVPPIKPMKGSTLRDELVEQMVNKLSQNEPNPEFKDRSQIGSMRGNLSEEDILGGLMVNK